MSEFQKQVNTALAPAVAGDFASTNPRASYLAGPGALVAGDDGLTCGLFAWVTTDSNGEPLSCDNDGTGVPQGFVHRDQTGLITTYLDGAGSTIPTGFEVTLMTEGDFWAKNETGSAVSVGDQVYVAIATGKLVASGGSNVAATGWKYASAGANGELVKITTHKGV